MFQHPKYVFLFGDDYAFLPSNLVTPDRCVTTGLSRALTAAPYSIATRQKSGIRYVFILRHRVFQTINVAIGNTGTTVISVSAYVPVFA